MRCFLFATFLVVACAAVAAAASIEDAESAYKRGDFVLAERLNRSLAEHGVAKAQYNLGWMYAMGQGVPQDSIRAHMWYSIAAAASRDEAWRRAIRNRGHAASQMTAAQIEKAQEMARHCQETKFKECD